MGYRKMNKILFLLSILALICSSPLQALTCRICILHKPFVGCMKGKDSCVALPGRQCRVTRITRFGGITYASKGCTVRGERCNIFEEIEGFGTVDKKCCRNRNFCNMHL